MGEGRVSEAEVHTSPITGDGGRGRGGGSSGELDKEMMAQGGDVCVRLPGHEEADSEMLSQVLSTRNLPREAVPQRAPATPRLEPRCLRLPTSTSCAGQTACLRPTRLAGVSED